MTDSPIVVQTARPVGSTTPTMMIAVVILGGWLVMALAASAIAPYDPNAVDIMNMLSPPNAAHLFGTDQVGRDVFSRVLFASRVDLLLCVAGVLPPLLIGTMIGLLSGYFGGAVDTVFMRIYDLTVAFPFFVLVLAIVGVLGPGLLNFILALALVGWVSYARLVRAQVLTIRESEYIQAAKCLGYRPATILSHHVLPNAIGPVIAYAASDAVLVMLAGASFGFLGMGAQPPLAEWGVMIADGQAFVQQAWWICLFPGLAAISLGLGFALLGDGLGQIQRMGVAA
ncbi:MULTISPECIES: ABC transporter permease [Sinorhizobium]|uniref:Nickel ABC transporter permease n=1 Tax=Sinorhizobium medicae TaxID=110321 RepID=A0ABX4TAY4_9HYPH|nr:MULTISPECIES: ABC transporter permease [Sinorhizobium]MDX0451576.1 ABC transporter permease subunit [Sinorhizobium medicae]MDX0518999.1 ABC transporter permease subunit [Sinorhizobium medicae]MDX0537721.1 ABC transporter permease subunit [Sinorhizobium medicae]MDX0568192.1 ABC transporter permease subunit [Sinorhizobium medicae]MDX0580816.1 ABC transporter permease subunit [Sinorhizobium medicae]